MNTGIVKSKASGLALMGKVLVGVMVLVLGAGMAPQITSAATTDVQFRQYLYDICFAPSPPPGLDPISLANLATLCTRAFPGGGGSSPPSTISANLGSVNAESGAAGRKKKGIRVELDDELDKPEKGASADGGGWGLLVSPLYSKGTRAETDLESGYQSKLTGLVIGLDYRFSDRLVVGLAGGRTDDEAIFNANVGFLKSSSSTLTMYGTWLPSESFAVDGYLGYGKLNLENQRQLAFGTQISGTMSGSTTGIQSMAGLSASYQASAGRFDIGPFINLDYIKTTIKSYNESGSNTNTDLIALHYGDRSVTSLTSSVGGRLGTSYGYDWGALMPSVRIAAVHEFQNRTRQISNELVLTPGTSFLVETDSPDRNYLNYGLGIAAAFDSGAQLFLDYEKRSQDKLLSSWAVSLGGLFEF